MEVPIRQIKQFKINLPEDVKRWVSRRAEENLRSQTAEIIFIIREKMAAATGEGLANTAPAAASSNNAALAGGAFITDGL